MNNHSRICVYSRQSEDERGGGGLFPQAPSLDNTNVSNVGRRPSYLS